MRKLIDLTGQRFGRLVVLCEAGRKHKHPLWMCQCDCGEIHYCLSSSLRSGRTRSCGCLNREQRSRNKTHGQSNTKLYHIYHAMRQRCYNENFPYYKYYGGRGVEICEEWQQFEPFRDWAMSHGYEDGLSIERKDVNKGYTPDNCEWIPMSQQASNRRTTVYVEWEGKRVTLMELSDRYFIERHVLYDRIVKGGWSVEKAVSTPIEKRSRPSVCETEKATRKKYTSAIVARKENFVNDALPNQ